MSDGAESTRQMQRIPFGKETPKIHVDGTKLYVPRDWADRCPDCDARHSELHEDGCDVEQCPECGHQLLSCDHAEVFLNE